MSIFDIHDRLGTSALIYSIIMAAWGLWRYFRRQEMDSNYWGALVIAEILFLVQAGVGAYILFAGLSHLTNLFMHTLYGIVSIMVIPAIFVFTRGDDTRRTMLIYGLGMLFVMGIILRGMATGGS